MMDRQFFIFFGVFIFIYLLIIFLLYSFKKRQLSKILLDLKNEELSKIEVIISIISKNAFKQYGGLEEAAILHYNKKFWLLTSKRMTWFSVQKNNLPIVLIKTLENNYLDASTNAFIVDEISIKNGFCILSFKDGFYNSKLEITVKKDLSKFLEIINDFKNS